MIILNIMKEANNIQMIEINTIKVYLVLIHTTYFENYKFSIDSNTIKNKIVQPYLTIFANKTSINYTKDDTHMNGYTLLNIPLFINIYDKNNRMKRNEHRLICFDTKEV